MSKLHTQKIDSRTKRACFSSRWLFLLPVRECLVRKRHIIASHHQLDDSGRTVSALTRQIKADVSRNHSRQVTGLGILIVGMAPRSPAVRITKVLIQQMLYLFPDAWL